MCVLVFTPAHRYTFCAQHAFRHQGARGDGMRAAHKMCSDVQAKKRLVSSLSNSFYHKHRNSQCLKFFYQAVTSYEFIFGEKKRELQLLKKMKK